MKEKAPENDEEFTEVVSVCFLPLSSHKISSMLTVFRAKTAFFSVLMYYRAIELFKSYNCAVHSLTGKCILVDEK